MNIVFLDIDGVLNNELFYLERLELTGIKSNQERSSKARHRNICPRCVEMLNIILEQNDAYIVISSSWRSDGDVAYWKKFMAEVGVFEAEKRVIGITPYGGEGCLRGNEIRMWIMANDSVIGQRHYEYENYVILDDDSDMLYWQRDHYFWIDNYCGLTPNIAYKVKLFFDKTRKSNENNKVV